MKTTWKNNAIQFPRMLAEIRAIGLTASQYMELNDSMDLSRDEIDEILERAETEWQKIKNRNLRTNQRKPKIRMVPASEIAASKNLDLRASTYLKRKAR